MSDADDELVRTALSLHTHTDPRDLEARTRLGSDLGLEPADIVLVLLHLEELAGLQLPTAELDALRTVGDLVALVSRWATERITLLPC